MVSEYGCGCLATYVHTHARTAQDENRALSPAPAPERDAAPVRKAAGPAGGVYIPPFKLAQMMAEQQDKEGPEYQRMTWDALRKSINGLINKVNDANIKMILPEIISEVLARCSVLSRVGEEGL